MARLSRTLELEVRRRAVGCCEYCLFPESASELPFHIDHIIAQKHRGQSGSESIGTGQPAAIVKSCGRCAVDLLIVSRRTAKLPGLCLKLTSGNKKSLSFVRI